ncbi:MAG: hypothetical protein HRU01_09655 [Myxococcales bacterium]|nr:hypothetical protein [Myxococcales bacterium]
MSRLLAFAFSIAVALMAAAPSAARVPAWLAGELSVSTGFDFRTGDYSDTVRTDLWYVPFSVGYSFDDFALTPYPADFVELKVTVPVLHVRGPGSILTEQGFVASPGGGLDSRGGIGDIIVRGTYALFPPATSVFPAFELTGRAKVPTASKEQALGTGEPAYSLQLDLFDRFGAVTPLVTVGYRFVVQSRGFDLENSWFTSVGAGLQLTDTFSLGLLYDFWQASSSTGADSHELFPYASWRITPKLRAGPYAVVGLSPGSPDYGLGLQISYRIQVR